MSILPIIKYPSKILREKTAKVTNPLEPEIQKLIKDMIETLGTVKGLGLAAPQVGSSARLCIIEDKGKTYILMNPQIKSKSRKKIILEEGCLSFPGKFFPIARSEKVKARYLDETGKKRKIKAEGLLARTLQHEIDHLEGMLIIDKIKKL
jgi:peptide deformylase